MKRLFHRFGGNERLSSRNLHEDRGLSLAIEVELTHVDIGAMRERCEVEEWEQGEAVSSSEKADSNWKPKCISSQLEGRNAFSSQCISV